MTEAQLDLARRAVACKGWRWMPGMLGWRPDCPPIRLAFIEDAGNALQEHGWLPDPTDAATLGCVLALVREAWGDSGMFVRPRGSKMRPDWAVFTGANSDIVCAALSEADALVAALEAAPNNIKENT